GFGHFPEVRFVFIAPSALSIAERPLRRDIAASDHLAEGMDNGSGQMILCLDQVNVQVPVLGGNTQGVTSGITDIKCQRSRIIDENAKGGGASDDEGIVGSVEGAGGLCVMRVIGTVAGVDPAPLIDPPHLFSQSVDRSALFQSKNKAFLCVCKIGE